jgi:hypothetical protein
MQRFNNSEVHVLLAHSQAWALRQELCPIVTSVNNEVVRQICPILQAGKIRDIPLASEQALKPCVQLSLWISEVP